MADDSCRGEGGSLDAFEEEGVAGAPSGTVTQLSNPGTLLHGTSVSHIALQGAEEEEEHWSGNFQGR